MHGVTDRQSLRDGVLESAFANCSKFYLPLKSRVRLMPLMSYPVNISLIQRPLQSCPGINHLCVWLIPYKYITVTEAKGFSYLYRNIILSLCIALQQAVSQKYSSVLWNQLFPPVSLNESCFTYICACLCRCYSQINCYLQIPKRKKSPSGIVSIKWKKLDQLHRSLTPMVLRAVKPKGASLCQSLSIRLSSFHPSLFPSLRGQLVAGWMMDGQRMN